MGKAGRSFILLDLIAMAIYLPFLAFVVTNPSEPPAAMWPIHMTVVVLNLAAFLVTLRDVWVRPDFDRRRKIVWTLLLI